MLISQYVSLLRKVKTKYRTAITSCDTIFRSGISKLIPSKAPSGRISTRFLFSRESRSAENDVDSFWQKHLGASCSKHRYANYVVKRSTLEVYTD